MKEKIIESNTVAEFAQEIINACADYSDVGIKRNSATITEKFGNIQLCAVLLLDERREN